MNLLVTGEGTYKWQFTVHVFIYETRVNLKLLLVCDN